VNFEILLLQRDGTLGLWTNAYRMPTTVEQMVIPGDRVYVELTTDTRTGLSSAHLAIVIHANSTDILAVNVNTSSLGVFPREYVYVDRAPITSVVSSSSVAPAGNGGGFGGSSAPSPGERSGSESRRRRDSGHQSRGQQHSRRRRTTRSRSPQNRAAP
jgi:hypothetical protein